jgi:hypothetical protein
MPDNSDGAAAPAADAVQPSQRGNDQRRANKGKKKPNKPKKFTGKTEGLDDVYYLTGGSESLTKVTEAIVDYVSRTIPARCRTIP